MTRETYRDPIFNLKAVVEATGVTADALRAWERRYGLPVPARTEAGHRIYSRRDIDIIKWLVARQDEGLRIGRAVDLWRSLEEDGQDPLRTMPPPSDLPGTPSGDQTRDLREEWIAACLAYDDQRAERALAQAFALFPPQVVLLEVLREGVAEIGRKWYQGEATVQQEHFASQLAVRRLKTLTSTTPRPTRRGRILVACPPSEEHVIGPSILILLLRRAGWDVVYLGADVPRDRMEQTVDATQPDLVVLSSQRLHTAATLLEMALSLHGRAIPVAFGGGVFNRIPSLREYIPGFFLGETLVDAVGEVERLVVKSSPPQVGERKSGPHREAGEQYLEDQLEIQAAVWRALTATQLDPKSLQEIQAEFSVALHAALTFGDIALLGDYVDWLERMKGSEESTRALKEVLDAYRRALDHHLGEYGAPIVSWLSARLERQA